jgi:hypothetical protein
MAGSRVIRSVALAFAALLAAVALRIGNRDPAVTAALIAGISFAILVAFRSARDRSNPDEERVRKDIAEIQQRLSALEGKVDGLLAILSPERTTQLLRGNSDE